MATTVKHLSFVTIMLSFFLVLSIDSSDAAEIINLPIRASGVQGVDWELVPGSNEISLLTAGQMVEIKSYLHGFEPAVVTVYQGVVDCPSLDADIAGGLVAITTNCTIGEGTFGVDYCHGVDESEPTYVLANAAATLPSCGSNIQCSDGDPSAVGCGTVALIGDSGPDAGIDYYMITFGFETTPDMRGTAAVTLNPASNQTILRDGLGDAIPIDEIHPALVTLVTGACCENDLPPMQCGDDYTQGECEAIGGYAWVPGDACSGVEIFPGSLWDSTCFFCFGGDKCADGNACTSDQCVDQVGCTNTDTTPPGQCCSPTSGELTPIDDNNDCTVDECQSDGTVLHTPGPQDWPCDDGESCTAFDACDGAGLCTGVSNVQTPTVVAAGSKALSITAEPAGAPDEIALFVTSPDWTCLGKYVSAEGTPVDDPVFQPVTDWGTIVVTGIEIVPESAYDIQAECAGVLSGIASVQTGVYADTDGNGGVNLADVQRIVFGFQLNFMFNTLEELDIWPCAPNQIINFEDIQHGVLAFQQLTYTQMGCPMPCP